MLDFDKLGYVYLRGHEEFIFGVYLYPKEQFADSGEGLRSESIKVVILDGLIQDLFD
jgi:hypothetical protein